MISKTHNYFHLSSSPWPVLVSVSSFDLLFSLCLFFKYGEILGFLCSVFLTISCSLLWWKNYLNEFCLEGLNTASLEEGVKVGMILFISSEIFFFFSFFWSYFHYFLSPGLENGFNWPPSGVASFEAGNVPFLNTLILLSSGVLVTISHFFLNEGKMKLCNVFLFFTFIMGGAFTLLQAEEYTMSFFSISDGNFGTSFFMLTGFHGIHVVIGSLYLLFVFFLSINGFSPSKGSFLSFELASWYWHFVDVVWIFLFFLLYYLNN